MSGQESWGTLPGRLRPLPVGFTMLLWVLLATGVLTFLRVLFATLSADSPRRVPTIAGLEPSRRESR
jgi:hypothetical protein